MTPLKTTAWEASTLPSEIYLEMKGKGHFSWHCLNFQLSLPAHPYV